MATSIFKSVNFPIPKGFSEEDVNLDAKKLYSDVFILNYLKFNAKFSMLNQTNTLGSALLMGFIQVTDIEGSIVAAITIFHL
jgi:hypothetical protein